MDAANRDGKLVAHSTPKCTRLRKREVMRIRRRSPAHKARLPRYELPVLLIAEANRFTQRTDRASARPFFGHCRSVRTSARTRLPGGYCASIGHRIGLAACDWVIPDRGEPYLKLLFDNLGIARCQGILGRKIPMCPGSRLIRRIDIRQLSDQALPKVCRLLGRQNGFR